VSVRRHPSFIPDRPAEGGSEPTLAWASVQGISPERPAREFPRRAKPSYTFPVLPILPCLLGLFFGWVIWHRWLAQTATILVWGLFLLPFAADSAIGGGGVRDMGFWLSFGGLFALSLLLAEAGTRLRDRYSKLFQ
jgi:hypothetical protein